MRGSKPGKPTVFITDSMVERALQEGVDLLQLAIDLRAKDSTTSGHEIRSDDQAPISAPAESSLLATKAPESPLVDERDHSSVRTSTAVVRYKRCIAPT